MRLFLGFLLGMVIVPTVVALLALAGRVPSDSLSSPPMWETGLGIKALAASLKQRAFGIDNPIAVSDEAALLAGMKLFKNHCAGCHGDFHAPSIWGAKGFYPRVPQLWQEPRTISPSQAYVAVRDGIRYSGMGAWRDLMSDREMWQVANFVSRMHELPTAVNEAWAAKPQG